MKGYKIFTVNPGSTSTKIALFEAGKEVFSANVRHDAKQLSCFSSLAMQKEYRKVMIEELLAKSGISLEGLDACVGRGGGLLAMEGGTYEIDDLVLTHSAECANGVEHPACLGPGIASEIAGSYQAKAYVVNPPDVDELQDLARMTGIKGVYRVIHLHALNLKETAIRHAESLGKQYEDCNFIVCHIGGGISISAHRKGQMVDGYDIVGGEGPMAPTRCGSISVSDLLRYCESKLCESKLCESKLNESGLSEGNPCKGSLFGEVRRLCTSKGGFVSHVGTSDALELTNRAKEGDRYAALLWNTMIYQIEKGIGAMAAVLHGQIDGILLGGGMVYNEDLVCQIRESCEWMAQVKAYPGEFEMEAMEAGARRVLNGTEKVKKYQGVCRFQGFSF